MSDGVRLLLSWGQSVLTRFLWAHTFASGGEKQDDALKRYVEKTDSAFLHTGRSSGNCAVDRTAPLPLLTLPTPWQHHK